MDFKTQTLHFYVVLHATTCDFPVSVGYPNPDRFLAWLPDGQVVVQAANGVIAGRPCGSFAPATAADIIALDHSDPYFSPDGRYQVMLQTDQGSSQGSNMQLAIKDVATGKALTQAAFMDIPGRTGTHLGYWLDADHYLVPYTGDQGPLLLTPGKPVVRIATDLFHQPPKPGNGPFDFWQAFSIVSKSPPAFHFMLHGIGDEELQIYHSDTGQVETLPYQVNQSHFSDDGHWLLVDQPSGQTLIRPLDPPGAPFQSFVNQADQTFHWSPDGSKVFGMSNIAGQQSVIWLYTSPQRILLSAWQAPGYELSPGWSPDGKYLGVWARLSTDYSQEAIFVIPVTFVAP